jgi:hypothetical protein
MSNPLPPRETLLLEVSQAPSGPTLEPPTLVRVYADGRFEQKTTFKWILGDGGMQQQVIPYEWHLNRRLTS